MRYLLERSLDGGMPDVSVGSSRAQGPRAVGSVLDTADSALAVTARTSVARVRERDRTVVVEVKFISAFGRTCAEVMLVVGGRACRRVYVRACSGRRRVEAGRGRGR